MHRTDQQVIDLQPHPAAPPLHARAVCVTLRADPEALHLTYRVAGTGALIIPATRAGERRNVLWQALCGELFVAGEGSAYREFNFSPAGDWAVYDFAGYRLPADLPPVSQAPHIAVTASGDELILSVRLPRLIVPDALPLWLAPTMVLAESGDGGQAVPSYWATAHGGPRPDFHDAALRTLELSPWSDPL